MGWEGITVMDQRVRFIAEYLNGLFPVNELCLQFNISRKTGYKCIKRYEEYGPEGLEDGSRKSHSCPHETDDAVIEAIVQARMKHPTWGSKKLLAVLSPRYPDLPAISTAADILKRKGLITPGKRSLRRRYSVALWRCPYRQPGTRLTCEFHASVDEIPVTCYHRFVPLGSPSNCRLFPP